MHNQIPGKEEGHVHQTAMQGLTLSAYMSLYSPRFHRSVFSSGKGNFSVYGTSSLNHNLKPVNL